MKIILGIDMIKIEDWPETVSSVLPENLPELPDGSVWYVTVFNSAAIYNKLNSTITTKYGTFNWN